MIEEVLPKRIYRELKARIDLAELKELRLRENAAVIYLTDARRELCSLGGANVIARREDVEYVLDAVSGGSLYAFEEQMKRGFITYKNLRIGLAGEANEGAVGGFRHVASLVIRRLAKTVTLSDKARQAMTRGGKINSVLVVSPPACGKTTLLRAMICEAAALTDVVVVDEKGELAAECGNDFERLAGMDKARAFEFSIRCLAAKTIICDELYSEEDLRLCERARASGVSVIATMHGVSASSLRISKAKRLFDAIIVLSQSEIGEIESVEFSEEE